MSNEINLTDLTNADYEALLENDKAVDKLIEFNSESTNLRVSDWLNLLDGVGDYSLSDSSQPNYMYISNSYNFLNSVLDVQKAYGLLADTMVEKVEKVLSDYGNSEPDLVLENELDKVGEQVAYALTKFAENDYDYAMESASLIEAMKEYEALIFIYGDDAYYNREDNQIYYVCSD